MGEERHYLRCTGLLKNGNTCDVILAARVAGLYVVKRQGFEMVAGAVHSVRCDRCHSNTVLPTEEQLRPIVEIVT